MTKIARFSIKWNGNNYRVSIPNYEGGEVVTYADHLEAMSAAQAKITALEGYEQHHKATQAQLGLTGLESRPHACYIADLQQRITQLENEVLMCREAAKDKSLSDLSVRVIVGGLDEPTDADLKWAEDWLAQHALTPDLKK
jgi:hypothetical protein